MTLLRQIDPCRSRHDPFDAKALLSNENAGVSGLEKIITASDPVDVEEFPRLTRDPRYDLDT